MPSTSLRIDDRIVSRCDDGLLEAEYALFDGGEIELCSTDPVTIREAGYLTTAGEARERLGEAGISIDLAVEAAEALSPEVIGAYARGSIVRRVIADLGAVELFEGRVYRSATRLYEGAWLDLRALAEELKVPRAGVAIQALHLVAMLEELDDDTSIFLSTAEILATRRPGLRTHRRIALDHARRIPAALRALTAHAAVDGSWAESDEAREDALRDQLLHLVRERAMAGVVDGARQRLATLDLALSSADAPQRGPLADPQLWAIERQLATGDTRGVDERITAIERTRGKVIATTYLRARAALADGRESPREVATRLSQLAASDDSFHELELLAARAWLAGGEPAHARYYARGLADDATAPDELRLLAIEILDATAPTKKSRTPPALAEEGATPVAAPSSILPAPVISIAAAPLPAANPGASQPPFVSELPPPMPVIPAPARVAAFADAWTAFAEPPRQQIESASAFRFASRPPPALWQRGESTRDAPPMDTTSAAVETAHPYAQPPGVTRSTVSPPGHGRHEPELLESLAMPAGADESAPMPRGAPQTALDARVAFTRTARELARDYRLWYGTPLRTDTRAIDAMQRHLRQRWDAGKGHGPNAMWELQRHGAMLSEILVER